MGEQVHAIARLRTGDFSIVQAQEVLEIADPWMNPCQGVVAGNRWASQVMWIVHPQTNLFAEIGWRRTCQAIGPRDTFYMAYGPPGVVPKAFKDGSGAVISGQPGERWNMSIMKDTSSNPQYASWKFQISGPGGTFQHAENTVSTSFAPNRVEVGGENLFDLNDMGVAGHLDPMIRLSNGAFSLMSIEPSSNLEIIREAPGRYNISRAFGGGFGNRGYFQVYSDIHGAVNPTEVPEGMPNCATPES